MDTILADALASSETGKAFSAFEAQGTSEAHPQERQRVWLAFAQTLEHDYSDQLNNAATDAAAQTALVALDQYVHHSSALSSGEISEFTNELDAEEALKRGERPETNPEYERALDEMIEAHRTLTACMPHWPVLF